MLKMLFYKKLSKLLFLVLFIPGTLSAQFPDFVGSLLNVERTANNLSTKEGSYAGLSYMIDKQSSFFVPSLVNAHNYLNNRPNIPDKLNWDPNFVLVSRSKDWGVTLGEMEFQKIGSIKRYGNYLNIWRRDRKGNWKIHLRAEVENYGKKNEDAVAKPIEYFEPDDKWYLKHRSQVRLGQREEVVMQSDLLFSTVLKANNAAAYDEFLEENVRFYYPWRSEIKGKKDVLDFLRSERIEITTEPTSVGRAYSGEYAYTSGTATVKGLEDKITKFNYVRVWKLQEDYQWRVLVEFMFER